MLFQGKLWGPDCQDWDGQQKRVILGAKESTFIHNFLQPFRDLHSPDLLSTSISCIPALGSPHPVRLPRASPSHCQSNISVLHPHTLQSISKYWERLPITALNSALHQQPPSTLTLVGSFCGDCNAHFAVWYHWHHDPCPAGGSFLGFLKYSCLEQRLSFCSDCSVE